MTPPFRQPRSGLNSYGARGKGGASPTPSCAPLAWGYQYISPSEIKKCLKKTSKPPNWRNGGLETMYKEKYGFLGIIYYICRNFRAAEPTM